MMTIVVIVTLFATSIVAIAIVLAVIVKIDSLIIVSSSHLEFGEFTMADALCSFCCSAHAKSKSYVRTS